MFKNNKALFNLCVFLIPLTFYFITSSPGIGFGDTAIIVDNIYHIKVNSQVNTHPLSVILGQPFMWLPIDNIAFKANLMSVVAGAVSVFLLYFVLMLVFKRQLVALLVAGIFMVDKSMWWHSTVVENYAVSSIITGLALIAFVKLWETQKSHWLQFLFFLVGLGFYNHVQFGFLGMGVGVAFLLHLKNEAQPFKFFLKCFAAILIGLMPWIVTVFIDNSHNKDLMLTLKMASVGVFEKTFFSVSFMQGLKDTGFVYFLEYPHLFLPMPFIGIYFAAKKMGGLNPSFLGILTYLVANTICFTYYNTWDRFAFLLQSFMILAFFGAFTVNAIFEFLDRKNAKILKIGAFIALLGCIFWSMVFYSLMTNWGKTPGSIWYQNWNNNYSNNLYEHSEFTINPNKSNYREIDIFAERLFETLPKGAIYIDDDSRTYYPIVMYFQDLMHQRKDLNVMLINSWSIDGWGNSPTDIANVILKARLKNQPLYMASLKWPFNSILAKLPNTIEFERVLIAKDRWIYKLRVDKQINEFDIKDHALPYYVDLSKRHVVPNENIFVTVQDMSTFNHKWEYSDQIFVNLKSNDNNVQIELQSSVRSEFKLALHLTSSNDFGRFKVSLNDRVILTSLDLKSAQTQPITIFVPEKVVFNKGSNRLKFELVDPKNAQFNLLGIDGVTITQVAQAKSDEEK